MIRQDIIANITQSLHNSLTTKITIIPDNLFGIENCLSTQVLQEIKDFVHQCPDSSWIAVQRQDYLARRAINWQPDTVIEELHIAIDHLTSVIKELFPGALHFHGIQLWRDLEGYNLPNHYDNTIIDCALQIYLFNGNADQGTTFVHQDREYTVPFKSNSGYLVSNRSGKALLHRTTSPVPAGHERYSLFAYWSLLAKAQ